MGRRYLLRGSEVTVTMNNYTDDVKMFRVCSPRVHVEFSDGSTDIVWRAQLDELKL